MHSNLLNEVYEELAPYVNLPVKDHPVDLLEEFYKIKLELDRDVQPVAVFSGHVDASTCNLKVGNNVILQPYSLFTGDVILGNNVRIGPFCLIRGPIFIGDNVQIGPYCELARSIILSGTQICHRNYFADSILGRNVSSSSTTVTVNTKINKQPCSMHYNGIVRETQRIGAIVEDEVIFPAAAFIMGGTHITTETKFDRPGVVIKPNGRSKYLGHDLEDMS